MNTDYLYSFILMFVYFWMGNLTKWMAKGLRLRSAKLTLAPTISCLLYFLVMLGKVA
ncbi:hypothetical protein PPEP_b1219 [Pseudoalteromonas peptidolytica F12-50-A1]|uniref:Uncharacterized protein n=1 Tax=Pseudoalteromonas peptidolytica F12-50-A1 TaxID=1315280 RepID=A0A8I0MZY7_9GAMM|nr:hypothetical protein [Pseudoalteromonas peptidolytica F12-50-A1]